MADTTRVDDLYDAACATVASVNLWCAQSWDVIFRLSPLPHHLPAAADRASSSSYDLTPISGDRLAGAVTAPRCANDLGADVWAPTCATEPASAAAYLLLACRLFPTSSCVGLAGELFCRAGHVELGARLIHLGLRHASCFVQSWTSYLTLLDAAAAPLAHVETALAAAIDAVGLDCRSYTLWWRLCSLRASRAMTPGRSSADIESARDTVRTAMSLPLVATNQAFAQFAELAKRLEEYCAAATGVPALGLPPSVTELQRIAREVALRELRVLPSEAAFPALAVRAEDQDRWQRWNRVLALRRTNPCGFLDGELQRKYVGLVLRQMMHQHVRQQVPHLLLAAFEHASSASGKGMRGIADELHSTLLPSAASTRGLLSAFDHALSRAYEARPMVEPHPEQTIKAMGVQQHNAAAAAMAAVRVQVDVAHAAAGNDVDAKTAKKHLRTIGKRCVAAGLPHWQLYDQWATAEVAVLQDASLIPDIARKSLTAAEAALKQRSIPAAGCNVLQLCGAAAMWAKLRGDEGDIRGAFERLALAARGVADSNAAPQAAVMESWARYASSEAEQRGPRAAIDVLRRRHTAAMERMQTEDDVGAGVVAGVATWGIAATERLAAMYERTSGNHLNVLSDEERGPYRVLGDLERAVLASTAEKETLFEAPSSSQLPPHDSPAGLRDMVEDEGGAGLSTPTAIDLSAWKPLKHLPYNPQPSRVNDDQNSDELCAAPSMKPHRKMVVDASATASKVWLVQKQAGVGPSSSGPAREVAEFFGPSSYGGRSANHDADDSTAEQVRLPAFLQALASVCSGLPAPAATAPVVRVEWIESLLREPLELKLPQQPAPRQPRRH